MRERHHIHKFTQEQVEQLAANPFTLSVTVHRISFTLEFKNLFLSRYETGESVKDIFVALGYDPDVIGYNRMYSFSNRLLNQVGMAVNIKCTHKNGHMSFQKSHFSDTTIYCLSGDIPGKWTPFFY